MDLRTPRLLLRGWRAADREPFAALNADPAVMEHFPAPLTREQSDALAERAAAGVAERGWGWWAVEAGGRFVGFVGLNPAPAGIVPEGGVEIGWRLARSAWGQGYATEAALACVEYAADALGVAELWSFTAVGNRRSRAVMERLGMRFVREFDHPSVPPGSPVRRHVLYRLALPAADR